MNHTEFKKQLLRRYVDNKATPKELEVLYNLIENEEIDNELYLTMEETWEKSIIEQERLDITLRKTKIVRWSWISAAAVLLMIGTYFTLPYLSDQQSSSSNRELTQATPVLPGKNTAVITLSNGKAIKLSSAKSGVVIGATELSYNDGSSLSEANDRSGQFGTATISTPRGGTYQVTLKDGSKIQLNAASSVTFSTDFEGLPERQVSLNGEAYFEVAKKSQPFVVTTRNQIVSVLGTHFNISAYEDDRYTKTTLIEGSVKINGSVLKPNQQAIQSDGKITVREVDATDAIDWKNGEFIARNESLENLMKKVSRWYDIDIAYENNTLKDKTFSGSLSRYSKAEDLLNALKFYGVNSRLINRKIYITN
jgi:transmembrane sensor